MSSKQEFSSCPVPAYKVRFISYDPLIMHIQDFITPEERTHVLKISYVFFSKVLCVTPLIVDSENQFKPSLVHHCNGSVVDWEGRTSSTANLANDDPVLDCIYQRVSEFQGYHAKVDIEPFQVTRYQQGQEFREHVDWYPQNHTSIRSGMNRLTTFFAILEADCKECGTTFPKIAIDWKNEDPRWCDVIDCDDTEHLTTKPVPGSALFWKNLHANGEGDSRVLHAGLSVKSGVKVGLNIWSRTQVSTALPEADPDNTNKGGGLVDVEGQE
jgi:prolyl 4-hydroxylase